MKLHQLQPKIKKDKKKRVGRGPGSGKGTYSGRGIKGQKARSGYKIPAPAITVKLPKLRGEGFRRVYKKAQVSIVNLADLDKKFKNGETVSVKSLIEKGLVDDQTKQVKILGDGELTKKLKFEPGILFSKKAKAAIEQITSSSKTN